MMTFEFHAESVSPSEQTVVVPPDIENKKELFTFLAQLIPLPDYFGKNWDALEECLTDLSWLPERKLTLAHVGLPLQGEPANQRTYLQLLASAAKETPNLRVVFPERCRNEVERILAA